MPYELICHICHDTGRAHFCNIVNWVIVGLHYCNSDLGYHCCHWYHCCPSNITSSVANVMWSTPLEFSVLETVLHPVLFIIPAVSGLWCGYESPLDAFQSWTSWTWLSCIVALQSHYCHGELRKMPYFWNHICGYVWILKFGVYTSVGNFLYHGSSCIIGLVAVWQISY
jgi:hypothetical protein